jgi:two-component system, OmpR family, alkaline phosphatase synthesis response regulator PhoP
VISLEFLMKREGFEVSIARTASEAVEKIRRRTPDLVLLDVMMPKKSGFEVCQEIKSDPALRSVRILMLTAKGRDTEVAKGLALGADCLHDQALFDQGTRGARSQHACEAEQA